MLLEYKENNPGVSTMLFISVKLNRRTYDCTKRWGAIRPIKKAKRSKVSTTPRTNTSSGSQDKEIEDTSVETCRVWTDEMVLTI